MTFEEQLFALLEQHNLSSLSITAMRLSSGNTTISASAQGDGKCALSWEGATASRVIGNAIGELNALRNPPSVSVDALQPLAEAA